MLTSNSQLCTGENAEAVVSILWHRTRFWTMPAPHGLLHKFLRATSTTVSLQANLGRSNFDQGRDRSTIPFAALLEVATASFSIFCAASSMGIGIHTAVLNIATLAPVQILSGKALLVNCVMDLQAAKAVLYRDGIAGDKPGNVLMYTLAYLQTNTCVKGFVGKKASMACMIQARAVKSLAIYTEVLNNVPDEQTCSHFWFDEACILAPSSTSGNTPASILAVRASVGASRWLRSFKIMRFSSALSMSVCSGSNTEPFAEICGVSFILPASQQKHHAFRVSWKRLKAGDAHAWWVCLSTHKSMNTHVRAKQPANRLGAYASHPGMKSGCSWVSVTWHCRPSAAAQLSTTCTH